VPRELIVDCIRISQQAPTGSNSQRWRWIVVEDAQKRAALAALYGPALAAYLDESEKMTPNMSVQTQHVYASARYLIGHLHEVPVHVIPCLEGRPAPGREASFYASIYPAVWSFQLALRARGLGSVLTTAHLHRAQESARCLGIPDDITQCGLLPVGYTIGTDFKPADRPAPDSIIHWNGW
jgi:nitroreductase